MGRQKTALLKNQARWLRLYIYMMNINNKDVFNWPNFVSMIRILLAPVMLLLAMNQQAIWFIVLLLFSEFTDVLDGFLARYLNQITDLGSRLDSWGDFVIYSTLAVSAWLLWPDIVVREIVFVIIIICSFTLPVLVGIIKLHTVTSYHTWSVKIAVAVTVISYILLFMDISPWPFRLAAMICIYAALEEIVITLLIGHERVDVRSFRQAMRFRNNQS